MRGGDGMAATDPSNLLTRSLDALERVSLGRVRTEQLRSDAASARAANARFEVDRDGVSHSFLCEFRPKLELRAVPAVAAAIEAICRTQHVSVALVTEYVSARVGEALREHGVHYIDASGNAHLAGGGLFLLIGGQPRKRARPQTRPEVKTTWSRAALPIVHRLLNEREALQRSYRDLAEVSTVSLGTVHNVMDDLKARGFLLELRGKTRLVERERLFQQWVASYPQYLRERLVRQRFTIPGPKDLARIAESTRAALGAQGWVLSGECAAWIMDGYLRPDRMTLYGNGDLDGLSAILDARPAADGAVEVLQAFWTGHTSPGGDRGLADPILVYADLLYSREPRAREAALRIRDEYIDLASAAG